MSFLTSTKNKAISCHSTIVLPEGNDLRVFAAAQKICEQNIAYLIILATPEEQAQASTLIDLEKHNITIIDPSVDPRQEIFAQNFCEIRAKKGMTLDRAREIMQNRLYFGNMLVREWYAHGLVGGSIASTPDMLRAAFQCIGTAPGTTTASSCFLMNLKEPTLSGDSTLLFADCGVNPDPTAEQLVDIALATAETHRSILGGERRIAFLSFSTKGSAEHPMAEKMRRATKLTQDRATVLGLDLQIDGELQFDAAIIPDIAAKKCLESPVWGKANILIFPDLNTGNIAYKITERLAHATAYGPILQGLAKPINDLSRGCSVDDIIGVVAITACQSTLSD